MQTIELGGIDERVSRLALGAMLMGTATDEARSFAVLDRYLDAGGSFVDTAIAAPHIRLSPDHLTRLTTAGA